MRKHEARILEKFKQTGKLKGHYIEEYTIPDMFLEAELAKRDLWLTNLAKIGQPRIDCVVLSKSETWLLEIKRIARLDALKLLGYQYLYSKYKNVPSSNLHLAIVCEICSPIYKAVFDHFGIRVWIV